MELIISMGYKKPYIKIWYSECNDGYMYAIYKTKPQNDDTPEDDGGLCTGTAKQAIDMACSQAGVDLDN